MRTWFGLRRHLGGGGGAVSGIRVARGDGGHAGKMGLKTGPVTRGKHIGIKGGRGGSPLLGEDSTLVGKYFKYDQKMYFVFMCLVKKYGSF